MIYNLNQLHPGLPNIPTCDLVFVATAGFLLVLMGLANMAEDSEN